ncbi:hypothetical protein E3N88_37883 [Mikania micrantha]|uniref:RING-type E3 ubiquitin transferase n=1 Tax=Mikania micrantha TaxID=192012 RepID=A0A5N6LSD1_9ASTR|nr:hypothetical protein E3N88_37883 [Mikania micrantha]
MELNRKHQTRVVAAVFIATQRVAALRKFDNDEAKSCDALVVARIETQHKFILIDPSVKMNHYSHYANMLQQPYHYVHRLPHPWVLYHHPAPYNTMPIFNPYYMAYDHCASIFNTPNTPMINHYVPYHQAHEDVFLADAYNESNLIREYEALLEESLIMQELEADPALQQLTARTNGSGLSEEEISKHLHVYAGTMTTNCEGEEADVCSICLDEFEKNNEKMGRLECGHRFHEGCIKRWLLSKNVCPMCRSTALRV